MKRTALIILSLLTVLSLTACTYDRSDNNNIKTDSGMAELQELQNRIIRIVKYKKKKC